MKKLYLILGAALLCLAGCDKAVTTTTPPQHLKLNLTINNGMAPATKSVKTDWADGDKVYVFFGKPGDHPTPAYLTLTRSGSSWAETWTEGLEAEIAATSDGTLTAFFSPIDIDGINYHTVSGLKTYILTGDNYCFALACDNVPYTVSSGVLSATMEMTLTGDLFVQWFLPGAADFVANLTFSNAHIMKSMGAGIIHDSGEVGSSSADYSEPIPGFAFDGGVIFSGLLDDSVSGDETEYTLTIVDNKGTDDTSDDVTYTLTKTATISQKDAILLPALSEWQVVHEYVEMGDGLKWATMNIGASKPEEYGDYFAWGETISYNGGKTSYLWATYEHIAEGWSPSSINKYINKYTFADNQKDGIWYDGDTFVGDNKTSLAGYDYEDDAARQIWKGTWRIPTEAEWSELLKSDKFDWTWTNNYGGTGKAGMVVTSKVSGFEGNSIFLPAAGGRYGDAFGSVGTRGYYWSSSLNQEGSDKATIVLFISGDKGVRYTDRYCGHSVRPVSE